MYLWDTVQQISCRRLLGSPSYLWRELDQILIGRRAHTSTSSLLFAASTIFSFLIYVFNQRENKRLKGPVHSKQTSAESLHPRCQYIPSGASGLVEGLCNRWEQQGGEWGFCPGPLDETLQHCIYRRPWYIFNAGEGMGPLETLLLRHYYYIQPLRSRSDVWFVRGSTGRKRLWFSSIPVTGDTHGHWYSGHKDAWSAAMWSLWRTAVCWMFIQFV